MSSGVKGMSQLLIDFLRKELIRTVKVTVLEILILKNLIWIP